MKGLLLHKAGVGVFELRKKGMSIDSCFVARIRQRLDSLQPSAARVYLMRMIPHAYVFLVVGSCEE